jgi:protein involved in polysaccharide export with SLBB domain
MIRLIQFSKKAFLLLLILMVGIHLSFAQTAGSISDAQILQIIAAANQRGMSSQEVAAFAKSKGYSDQDINAIMQRANTLNANNGAGQSSSSSMLRQQVQFGKSDIFKTGSFDTSSLNNQESKIFGYEVFHNNSISFSPNINMATPKDYVVGPGDQLIVQVYGIAQASFNLYVNSEGKVVIPNVGVVHVGSLSIDAVKSMLTQKIGTRYAGLQGSNPSSFLMLTVGNIRTIKINIVGDVKTPGAYELPSFTTIFNALYAAGGPTINGSFREVQLFRGGKQIANTDLYEFLLKGKTDKNLRLEDNDVLLIPKYNKRVELVGEVRRNLFFELKGKETVENLIEMAGGFTESAYKKMVTIQRINGLNKSIINVSDKEQASTVLEDGDFIAIGKTLTNYKNRIQILGSVNRTGDYELKANLKVADLIELAGGLKADAFYKRAILYRTNNDLQQESINIDLSKAIEKETTNNIILQKEDLLVIASIYDIKENYFVTLQGEVNQTGVFPYTKGMTIGELILKANGFKEAASGSSIELVRRVRDDNDKIANIIHVEVEKDLSIKGTDKDIALEPFDQVYVRAAVGFRNLKKVYVQGEANYTGQYIMDKPNMTIGDLLKRAGGVLNSSNVKGALLIRRTIFYNKVSNENDYLNKLEELRARYVDSTNSGFTESAKIKLSQLDKEINELYVKKIKNQETSVDIGNLSKSSDAKNKNDTTNKTKNKTEQENIEDLKTALQARVFKNLRDVTVNEDQYQFVSINLEKIIATNSASKYDVQLQEGDILYIPTFNETVSVSGDVLYPVAVKYEEGATLKDYINQAGGFNNTALKSKSYVVEANGVVKRTHQFFGIRFYPEIAAGAQIFVPQNNKQKSNFSIDRILGLTSSLVTTYLLIQNLTK